MLRKIVEKLRRKQTATVNVDLAKEVEKKEFKQEDTKWDVRIVVNFWKNLNYNSLLKQKKMKSILANPPVGSVITAVKNASSLQQHKTDNILQKSPSHLFFQNEKTYFL